MSGPVDVLAARAEAQAQAGGEAAPEPFAWFAFADHNGPVPLELYGWDRKACLYAVLMLARSEGWKGTVHGYLFHKGWTVKPAYTAPPSAPVGVVELVGEWRRRADHCRDHTFRAGYQACANQLESALAQQPAAVAVDAPWQQQLADALDAFWNPACGAIQEASYHGPASGSDVVGAIAQGLAAVAAYLREHQEPKR